MTWIDCQQKMPITWKYISTIHQNKIDKPLNPLKQGISHNHKQETNLMATRKLSAHETSETPRNQTFKRQDIPYKVGDEGKRREKQKQRDMDSTLWNPFHLLKETITALGTWSRLDDSGLLYSGDKL